LRERRLAPIGSAEELTIYDFRLTIEHHASIEGFSIVNLKS
jgi:hypothetical protein